MNKNYHLCHYARNVNDIFYSFVPEYGKYEKNYDNSKLLIISCKKNIYFIISENHGREEMNEL